ncbi:MAG: hypothetical protein QOG46_409, partial [Pseudonocardiales bacterium]|nr:hypothetical protein [Pseudonocardiales bacterium]
MQQRGAGVVGPVPLGDQRFGEHRGHPRVPGRGGQLLVGEQLRLHNQQHRHVHRLDLVVDRDHSS